MDLHLLYLDFDWPSILICTRKFVAYVEDSSLAARIWDESGWTGFLCSFLCSCRFQCNLCILY